jgi:hypothetical protein
MEMLRNIAQTVVVLDLYFAKRFASHDDKYYFVFKEIYIYNKIYIPTIFLRKMLRVLPVGSPGVLSTLCKT